jgi:hypothetical protein
MPTKLRRIAVTEDPDLSAALRRAALVYPGLSRAGLVRELALRGARQLSDESGDDPLQRILERTGAEPPRGDITEYLRGRQDLARPDPDDPHPLTKYLDEMREDSIH